jgi:hypothetical protein
MVRIAITQAAFEAIARTLPLGNVAFENKIDENGHRLIWLDRSMVDSLRSLRSPGKGYRYVGFAELRVRIRGDDADLSKLQCRLLAEDGDGQRQCGPPLQHPQRQSTYRGFFVCD